MDKSKSLKGLKCWVWLSSLERISPKTRCQLARQFNNPEGLWNASEKEIREIPFINPAVMEDLLNKKKREEAGKKLAEVTELGIEVVTLDDDMYPAGLKNIYDPPLVLYVKGKLAGESAGAIAIVGSRRATSYGRRVTEAISRGLAGLGITVVSGMARGIDSYAHIGALAAGGRTVAVLGCGLDIAYPRENAGLMERIAGCGAVVSEYLPGVHPTPYSFPMRNRIISGMCEGVVVVEAGERSGSLITADFALQQGREVFAVPGNIDSINSIGTNRLIKEGAKMVTCIDDILEELRGFAGLKEHGNLRGENNNIGDGDVPEGGEKRSLSGRKKALMALLAKLDGDEKKVVKCIVREPLHIDAISRASGLSIQDVSSILLMLELKGIVEQEPGKVFRLRDFGNVSG